MSITEIVGFDNLASPSDLLNYMPGFTPAYTSIVPGRFGGNGLKISSGADLEKVLPAPQPVVMIGFAAKGDWAGGRAFFILEDGGTNGNYDHLTFTITSGGVLQVLAGNSGGSVIASATLTGWSSAQWYYYEFGVLISPTAGTIQVWWEGALVMNLTGQNTNHSLPGNNSVSAVHFFGNGTGSTEFMIDDMYFATAISDQCGPRRVQTLTPVAASGTPQWNPLSGSNVSQVNSLTMDGDTSYNYSDTPGQTDLFTVSALASGTTTITCVQPRILARKDDAGARTISTVVSSGGTATTGTALTLTTAYEAYVGAIVTADPNGSIPWTATTVNAMTVGYTEVS